MATVTKKELIDRIAERTQAKRVSVKRIIQTFLDEIISELCRDNRLEFRDFGVFETRRRASRVAQNPKTLARVEVPMKRTVKFKMGRLMREHLSASAREGESKRELSRLARGPGSPVRKVALGDPSKSEVSDLGARAQAKPSL